MITIGSIVTVQESSGCSLNFTNTGIVEKIENITKGPLAGQTHIILLTNSPISTRVRYDMSSIIESEEIKKKNRAYKIELPSPVKKSKSEEIVQNLINDCARMCDSKMCDSDFDN